MRRSVTGALRSDQELVAAAGEGDSSSYEELYRRHLPAATAVAMAVTGNRDDAQDAVAEGFVRVLKALPSAHPRSFRSYLLTATRHAAIDCNRQSGRVRPTDDLEALGALSLDDGPAERAVNSEDGVLLSRAFAGLPERSRMVLWLLDVERLPAQEVADVLGLTANNVAQIAVRGRARLRERYLQAHLGAEPAPACEFTTRRLGAYLNATLSRRDATKADKHLQTCTACARRREDLLGLGLKMRTLLPVPLAVIPILRARTGHRAEPTVRPLVGTAANHQLSEPVIAVAADAQTGVAAVRAALELGASQVLALSGTASPLVQRLVGGGAAVLVAVGVSTIAVRTDAIGVGSAPVTGPAATATASPGPGTNPAVAATSLLSGEVGPGSGGPGGTVSGPTGPDGLNLLGIGGPDPATGAAAGGQDTSPPGALGGANLPAALGLAVPDLVAPAGGAAIATGTVGLVTGTVGGLPVQPGGAVAAGADPAGGGAVPAVVVPLVAAPAPVLAVGTAVGPGLGVVGIGGIVPTAAGVVSGPPVGEVAGVAVSTATPVLMPLPGALGAPGLTPVAEVLHQPVSAVTTPIASAGPIVGAIPTVVPATGGAVVQTVEPVVADATPAAGESLLTLASVAPTDPLPAVVPQVLVPVVGVEQDATTQVVAPAAGIVPAPVPLGLPPLPSLVPGIGI